VPQTWRESRPSTDDLDEIVVRLERKSRYAEKGLLIEHETEW